MIFESAYQTLALNGYQTKTIEQDLIKYSHFDGVLNQDEGLSSQNLYFIDAKLGLVSGVEIPSFNHPILINGKVIVDQRANTRIDMKTQGVVISNGLDYAFNKQRAYLNYWMQKQSGVDYLYNLGGIAMKVFVDWISEAIARRFSLDPSSQYRLMVLAGVYYCTLFKGENEWNEDFINTMVIKMTREIKVNQADVFEMVDNHLQEPMKGIADFCEVAKSVSQNVRLEQFNAALLFTLIGGTWLGGNSREVACVGLEHIPTYLTMLSKSISERGFNASSFSKIVKRKTKSDTDNFQKKIDGMLNIFRD